MLTCREFQSFESRDGYYQINTNSAAIRLWFLTDDIIRIRASFDQKFEEASYILTKTAWPDRLDEFLGDERVRVQPVCSPNCRNREQTGVCHPNPALGLRKNPIAFQLF